MDRQQRLRIAVQKSGRLTDESLDLLHRCGLKFSRGKDQLMCYGENMPLDVLFVRDDDIPDLVQEDVCDLGLVGLNVLEEKRLAMLARGTTPQRPEGLDTPDKARAATTDALRALDELLARKTTPEEAKGFKLWLQGIAQKVAEASNEGGFLGFGGEKVSAAEKQALASISEVLHLG